MAALLGGHETSLAGPGEDPNRPDTLGGYFPLGVPRQADFKKADCFTFSPVQGTPIVVCRPESDGIVGKALTIVPSLVVSLVALVISLKALRYNQTKDQRARIQSIKDDYWLRKVVSPVSIEPFVAFSTELMMRLPPVLGMSMTVDEESALMAEQLQRVQTLSVAFDTLRVVDSRLASEVRDHIGRFEDLLVTYKFNREVHLNEAGKEPSRPEILENLAGVQHDVLSAIQRLQGQVA